MKKIVLLIAVVAMTAGCGNFKPIARTVLDVARAGCEMFAAEQGLSISDVCATEKQLQPFIDGLLAAKRQHGATHGVERCADVPAEAPAPEATATPEAAPVAAPAPAPAPAAAPAPAVEEPKKD